MSLTAPKSFFGGTFFGGEYFQQKAHGTLPLRPSIPPVLKARGPSREDLLRSRGRFQVLITAEKLIELVAARYLDDFDQAAINALYLDMQSRYMEWDPEFEDMMVDELGRQREARDAKIAEEAKAKSDWLDRRQRKLMRMH